LIVAAIVAVVGTGGGVWYIKDKELKDQRTADQATIHELQARLNEGGTPEPSASPDLSSAPTADAAQTVVKQFVLTVANPSQPGASVEQKKTAVKYLSETLGKEVAAKYAGDPTPLLGLTTTSTFDVPLPSVTDGQATVTVSFNQTSGAKKVTFTLRANGGFWLIEGITPAAT
jgi:hypothetical protein